MTDIFIGVDVSKDWIDVFHPKRGNLQVRQSLRELENWVRSLHKSSALVVFEATGGYDAMLREALDGAEVPYHRANPARARDFARAVGIIGKTDRVDARCLSQMGRQLELAPTPKLSAAQSALRASF